jgi:hypothetical protein
VTPVTATGVTVKKLALAAEIRPRISVLSWNAPKCIRRMHDRDYDVRPSETAEFWGACHKQFINREENQDDRAGSLRVSLG